MTDTLSDAGNHFIIGLKPGVSLDPHDASLLRDIRPAGVILYKSNFHHDLPYDIWLERHAALIDAVRDACARDTILIAIDHEGGRVCRTPPPITRFSYPARWAKTAAAVGAAMGAELASLGLNLDFAPLLDVNSNPNNPVIGERAFSSDPETVGRVAVEFMTALENASVSACGKHFPGHGDAMVDSHYGLPVIDASLETLRNRELKPFVTAIKAGLSMIMTSHILFPALDPKTPATLSPRIVGDLLRGELEYSGVVVSDDIGMHAMDGLFDDPRAAVRFIEAGNDMLMICAHFTDTARARGFAQEIIRARARDGAFARTLDKARERVETLLKGAPRNSVRALEPEELARHRLAGELFEASTVEVV